MRSNWTLRDRFACGTQSACIHRLKMGIRRGHRCVECGHESRILCADAEELLGFRVGLRALVSNKDGRSLQQGAMS